MAQVGRRPRRTVEEQELLDVLARLEGRELTGSIVNRMRSLLLLVVNAISTNRLVKGFRVDELRTNIRASSPVAFIR
jgi:hypothetical protein